MMGLHDLTISHRNICRVLRVEQTETPAMLKARNQKLAAKRATKDKCVLREVRGRPPWYRQPI